MIPAVLRKYWLLGAFSLKLFSLQPNQPEMREDIMSRKTTIFGMSVLLIFLIGFYSNAIGATLSWNASTGEVTGYRLYYSTTEGSYIQNVDVGNVTSYSTDSLSLTEGTTYYFVVTAYNSAGESGYSNMILWTPPLVDTTPPLSPTEVDAKEVPE